MSIPFVDDIDLGGNRLLRTSLEALTADPASPTPFRIYALSSTGFPKYWNPILGVFGYMDARAYSNGEISVAAIGNLSTTIKATTLDQFAAPVAPLNLSGYELKGIGTGIANTSAVRVDQMNLAIANAIAGVKAIKDPVRAYIVATTTSNMTGIPSAANADGVTLNDGDQVWVPNADATGGKWIVHNTAWVRPVDWTSGTALEEGTQLVVNEGTSYAGSTLRVTNTGTITVGTTAVTVQVVQKANAYVGDNNTIVLSGLTFSTKIDGAGWLTYSANGVAADKTKVSGKAIALPIVHDGSTRQFTIVHNLALAANQAPGVSMVDAAGNGVTPSWVVRDTNSIVVTFGIAQVAGVKYYVSVYG